MKKDQFIQARGIIWIFFHVIRIYMYIHCSKQKVYIYIYLYSVQFYSAFIYQ